MKVLISILFVLLFVACSNTNSNSTTTQVKEPFSIKMGPSRTPIAVNAKLILTVSTPLDPVTVNKENIYLQDVYGSRHPIDVSLTGQQILIKPLIYLAADTTYELIVTTNVIAADGQKRTNPAIISFTSSSSIDTTAPTLTTTLPLNNSANMEPYGLFYFQFSETLSPLFDLNATRLYDQNDQNISGVTTLMGSLISFKPDINLTNDMNYTLALDTSSITDLSSNDFFGSAVEEINLTITTTSTPIYIYQEITPTQHVNGIVNSIIAESNGSYSSNVYLGGENGLDVFYLDYNISEPNASTIQPIAALSPNEIGTIYDMNIDFVGERAYLASSLGLFIVDINDTYNPQVISSYQSKQDGHTIPIYGLDINGTHLYAAATSLGVLDINISDENNLTSTLIIDTNGTAFDVSYLNKNLYISDYDQDALEYNLTNALLTPTTILSRTHNVVSYTDFSLGDMVMLAGGAQGLLYYTVSSPNALSYPTASYISQLKLNKDLTNSSFAIAKGIGLVIFSKSSGIKSYQYMDFEITCVNYAYINDTSIVFVVDTAGYLHVY